MAKKTKIVSPYLHNELTDYMDSHELTVRQMADGLGLSYNYLRRVVNGELFPRRQTLLEICKKTGTDFKTAWSKVLEEKVAEQKSLDPLPWKVDPDTGQESATWDKKAYKEKKRDHYLETLQSIFRSNVLTDNDKAIVVRVAELLIGHHEEAQKLAAAPPDVPESFDDPSEMNS